MQKTKLPPVGMQHVCKYTDEIIEKLKKKKWSYNKKLNMWVNSAKVCGFLHQKDSFGQKTETNNNMKFYNLSKHSYKIWNRIKAVIYMDTTKNRIGDIVELYREAYAKVQTVKEHNAAKLKELDDIFTPYMVAEKLSK